MLILKTLQILLTLVFLSAPIYIEASVFEFELIKNTIQPAERTTLVLRISGSILEKYLRIKDVKVNDSLLIGQSNLKLLSQKVIEGEKFVGWQYELTSYDEGVISIPPIELIIGEDTYSSEALKLLVSSSRAIDDFELRPEFGPIIENFKWIKWFLWLLLVPFFYLIYLLAKKFNLKLKPKVNLHRWLKYELEQLEFELEKDSIDFSIFDRLSFLIKKFYSLKAKDNILALTTREFLYRFHDDIKKTSLGAVLTKCDGIKYYNHKPKEAKNILKFCILEIRKTLSV